MENNGKKGGLPFVGPKALFDKSFVPQKVYGQKKITEDLAGYLHDFSEDNLSCVTTIAGTRGMGKKLLVRRTLNRLVMEKKIRSNFLLLECENKNTYSILVDITDFIARAHKKRIKDEAIFGLSVEQLWNLIKHLSKNLIENLVIMLDSAEFVDKKQLMKLVRLSKNRSNLHLIVSFNVSGSNFKVIEMYEVDKRIGMPEYQNSDLYLITKDRAEMAIRGGLATPILAFVVDSVSEYGTHSPGTCIGFLKELYPTIFETNELRAEDARMHARYYFGMKMMDSISIADILMESTMLERLVLDNLVHYFKGNDKFYIPFSGIADAYRMGCESLECKPIKSEFVSIVGKFTENYVILPSPILKTKANRINGLPIAPYFLTMPADELSELLDACFDGFDDEV
mgnify:CR=1 FL=1